MNGLPYLWWGAVLVVVSGFFGALALRRRFPRAWWLVFGWPALWWRMRRSWHALAMERDLTTSRRPNRAYVSGVEVSGRAVERIFPRLSIGFPRVFRVTARVRLLDGQVPGQYEKAIEAMVHAWRVHAVRLSSAESGFVTLRVIARDPLAKRIDPFQEGRAGELRDWLRIRVGVRGDGRGWVLDLLRLPHWLITGATRSGKSTLLNAIVVHLAPFPVALFGVDLKGGIELGPYLPRLSALATTPAEAAEMLESLVDLMSVRMRQCRAAGAKSVWKLPDANQPVPVVVFVDEIAELFLTASRADAEAAGRAVTALTRLAQLGAGLGVYLIVAGQRLGSELGKGLTLLRAQLVGRVCFRVADEETAKMTLGDKATLAVQAALEITENEPGVAVTTGVPGRWMRARSVLVAEEHAAQAATENAGMRQVLPELLVPVGDGEP